MPPAADVPLCTGTNRLLFPTLLREGSTPTILWEGAAGEGRAVGLTCMFSIRRYLLEPTKSVSQLV